MAVFEQGVREDSRPRHPKESAFAYLNRSARPEAAQARERIEDWLARYPEAEAGALASRLQSPLDDQHRSAFFELLLHELLLARGHRVAAIEPWIFAESPVRLVSNPWADYPLIGRLF